MKCYICGKKEADIEKAIDEGWIPSAWKFGSADGLESPPIKSKPTKSLLNCYGKSKQPVGVSHEK